MRANLTAIFAGMAILAFVGACRETGPQRPDQDPAGATAAGPATAPAAAERPAHARGTVLETMNSGGYTYVRVHAAGGPEWYAGPETAVAVGDTVILPPDALPMRNFESKTLGRTFALVYFVGAIRTSGGSGAAPVMPGPHGAAAPAATGPQIPSLRKAEGGLTVAEVFQAGPGAAGREVVLRGQVVKVNAGILGRNWLHVRDGTGEEGTNDITVTTQDVAEVGDVVLVRGTLAADRDFGHGYRYALLIEEASLVVE